MIKLPNEYTGRVGTLPYWCHAVVQCLRELRDAVETVAAGTLTGEVWANIADGEAINPNDVIHVRNGVAYQAVATNTNRYATHWAVKVETVRRRVLLGNGASARLNYKELSGSAPALFLSDVAGRVTNKDPYIERATRNGQLRQFLGYNAGRLDSENKGASQFLPGQPDAIGRRS